MDFRLNQRGQADSVPWLLIRRTRVALEAGNGALAAQRFIGVLV